MPVKLIECPRDAWQGLKGQVPTYVKAEYLRALMAAGFRHIDAVSFVSPKAVPQMADSEEVLKLIDVPDEVELIAIVVNEKGVERAIAAEGKIRTVGFPYSVSATFLRRNQNQSPEESLEIMERIKKQADENGLEMVVYVSMAFGNPYGDLWTHEEVVEAVRLIVDTDIHMISLADTVGSATVPQVSALVEDVRTAHPEEEIGVHLHARPGEAAAKVLAAYDAGCRRFDSAIGGLGGCPFAQDDLVGNIPTEKVLEALRQRGAVVPELGALSGLLRASAEIATRFGSTPTQ